jgi:hypothetical protein
MKKLFFLFSVFLWLQENAFCQENELNKLEKLILNQIENDKRNKKDFLILDKLKVTGENFKETNPVDSVNFLYNGGWNLGFYLISSSEYKNVALLEINKLEEDWKYPVKPIKMIKHNSNNALPVYFCYAVPMPDEWFNIKLQLENNKSGVALLILTVFSNSE